MARNSNSNLWYLPLFSGTETTARRPGARYDPDALLGQLPGPPPWATIPELGWWWDAASAGTLHGGATITLVDDRAGLTPGTAIPGIPGPTVREGGLDPQTLDFNP